MTDTVDDRARAVPEEWPEADRSSYSVPRARTSSRWPLLLLVLALAVLVAGTAALVLLPS